MMEKDAKIYVAGHRGMVGSAIVRALEKAGYHNIVTRTHKELNLCRQQDVEDFFAAEKPDYVFLAAASVPWIQLYLSENGSAADAGELPAHFRAGKDERSLCACKNFRSEILRVLKPPVRNRLYFCNADQSLRTER